MSKYKRASRLYDLRSDVKGFLELKNDQDLAHFLNDKDYLQDMAFLADILEVINQICKELLGRDKDVFQVNRTIIKIKKAMIKIKDILNENVTCLQRCNALKTQHNELLFEKYIENINDFLA